MNCNTNEGLYCKSLYLCKMNSISYSLYILLFKSSIHTYPTRRVQAGKSERFYREPGNYKKYQKMNCAFSITFIFRENQL